jgi:hypothetical protein
VYLPPVPTFDFLGLAIFAEWYPNPDGGLEEVYESSEDDVPVIFAWLLALGSPVAVCGYLAGE